MLFLKLVTLVLLYKCNKVLADDDTPAENQSTVNWYCPEGWTAFNDGHNITCLWFSNTSLYQVKAQTICKNFGSSLVKLHTEDKIKAFKDNFSKLENDIYIGLRKERGYDASYMWDGINGLEIANISILPTSVKESIHYKLSCVYINTQGEWDIDDCETEYNFVCEKSVECKPGSFGDKCFNQCHCLGEPCNPKSSEIRCKYGCQTGWMGNACDLEKQDPDVKYYCVNSQEKGKYVNIRIYTKGVHYRSIYGLNVNKTRSPWCYGSSISEDIDSSLPVTITIPVKEELQEVLESGSCAGEHLSNDTYLWTVVIKENEGILLEHDLQVTIKCDFSKSESLIRNSAYSVIGQPTELHKQFLEPQSTEDDVSMQVVDSYSGQVISEAAVGSSVTLTIKFGLKEGSLIKGITPYDCYATSPHNKFKKQLIDSQGCPMSGSPISAFSERDDNSIQTQWFPLFAFEGEQNVVFQCSFDLCFLKGCQVGCRAFRFHKRSAEDYPETLHEHFTKSTIAVLANKIPISMPESKSADNNSLSKSSQTPKSSNILAYFNPVTCSIFLVLLVLIIVTYMSFMYALRKSVGNIRREIDYVISRDKLLCYGKIPKDKNCDCNCPYNC
nr:hypothetical protein BgiMline_016927 [Biomphalaria glabrata]